MCCHLLWAGRQESGELLESSINTKWVKRRSFSFETRFQLPGPVTLLEQALGCVERGSPSLSPFL